MMGDVSVSDDENAAFREVKALAEALFKAHYAHEPYFASGAGKWEPLDTTAGIIMQIDIMVSGLVRPTPLHDSAPDLLAALQDALGWITEGTTSHEMARAAIAKATGE